MIYLIYISSAVKSFTEEDLIEVLKKSRENNTRLGITGMLLFKDGNFLQVLEGEESGVMKLYDTIARDSRHHGLSILDQGPLAQRQFADWSMGFRNLDDDTVKSLPGFNQFMNKPLTLEEFGNDPTGCRDLLNLFRESL